MDSSPRPLSSDERRLAVLLLSSRREGVSLIAQLDQIRVREMSDGGMRSLRFEGESGQRSRSATVASAQFRDADGIPVLVSLDLDQNGRLFELDIWKVDFSPLQKIPENSHIQVE